VYGFASLLNLLLDTPTKAVQNIPIQSLEGAGMKRIVLKRRI
jgi:hypothetical protein